MLRTYGSLRHRVNFALVSLFLTAVALATIAPSATDLPPCYRIELKQPIFSVLSGAWTHDGQALLLADTEQNRLFLLSRAGRLESTPAALGRVADFKPSFLSAIYPLQRGSSGILAKAAYLLQMSDERFVAFDESFSPTFILPLREQAVDGNLAVDWVWNWVLLGGELVAFVDMKEDKPTDSEDHWTCGLVRIPLGSPGDFHVLRQLDIKNPSRAFYRLGSPYVASIGQMVYFLNMQSPPQIEALRQGGEQLEPLPGLPEYLRSLPNVPPGRAPMDFLKVGDIPGIAVSMFGWEGKLYVVSRPDSREADLWRFAVVDPTIGKHVATLYYRSSASNLTMVPGPSGWAIVERGPRPEHLFKQEVRSITIVPDSRIRNAASERGICD